MGNQDQVGYSQGGRVTLVDAIFRFFLGEETYKVKPLNSVTTCLPVTPFSNKDPVSAAKGVRGARFEGTDDVRSN